MEYTNEQNMKINQGKSKVIVFNFTKKWQFPPEMGFKNYQFLENAREAKNFGLVISEDLKWTQHSNYIVCKAMSRIWSIRRMKNLGLTNDIIFDVYVKEIRSLLEFGCPVWNGGLLKRDEIKILKVQKLF